MKLKVITPVGPGHEDAVRQCRHSVLMARQRNRTWGDVEHVIVDDTKGKLGRSAARNSAIHGADWYFFLDADDEIVPDALNHNDFDYTATFGRVCVEGRIIKEDCYPCGKAEAFSRIVGTLSMGFFYKDCGLRFNEGVDAGEDFEFYVRLPDWVKIGSVLVNIRRNYPSATGPRGYEKLAWVDACREAIKQHIQ